MKHKKHQLSVARNGCFSWKSNKLQQELFSNFRAWMETLEVLRGQTLETPVLVWNDVKRKELKKVYNNIGLLRVSLEFRVFCGKCAMNGFFLKSVSEGLLVK